MFRVYIEALEIEERKELYGDAKRVWRKLVRDHPYEEVVMDVVDEDGDRVKVVMICSGEA